MEADGKPSEVKEKLPIKRSKGSLGSLNMITGKNNEHGKSSGASANGGYSKRYGAMLVDWMFAKCLLPISLCLVLLDDDDY